LHPRAVLAAPRLASAPVCVPVPRRPLAGLCAGPSPVRIATT